MNEPLKLAFITIYDFTRHGSRQHMSFTTHTDFSTSIIYTECTPPRSLITTTPLSSPCGPSLRCRYVPGVSTLHLSTGSLALLLAFGDIPAEAFLVDRAQGI